MRHDGTIAIVTGAGHGIGREIALQLAREGAAIAVVEIDAERGRETIALLADAAAAVILQRVPELGGDGGAIAVDRDGNIAMPFSTSGMYRGWIGIDGKRGTAIFS